MSDIALRVDGLGKRYRLGIQDGNAGGMYRYKSLRDSLGGWARHPLRTARQSLVSGPMTDDNAFWALKDVGFEVQRGEVVGIIGRNGAGKSTLLKILSRITKPTTGRVDLFGRVGSLLEVGTGFHPELTGRENIYLNGAILGMTRAEVRGKFDEIVAFSEVEQFLDMPVKQYSSGMYVRLAFAVAAHLESDILIIDEVLAVGDNDFQDKCIAKMRQLSTSGRTVLFVSHNMAAVRRLCTSAIILASSRLVRFGPVEESLAIYARSAFTGIEGTWTRPPTAQPKPLTICSVQAELKGRQPDHLLTIGLNLTTFSPHRPAWVAIEIADEAGVVVMQPLPTITGFINDNAPSHRVDLEVSLPPLIPGRYLVSAAVLYHNTELIDDVRDCAAFEVIESPTAGRTYPHTPDHGYIVPRTRFSYTPLISTADTTMHGRPATLIGRSL